MEHKHAAEAAEKESAKNWGRIHDQTASTPSPASDGGVLGMLGVVATDGPIQNENQQSAKEKQRSLSMSSSNTSTAETFQPTSTEVIKGDGEGVALSLTGLTKSAVEAEIAEAEIVPANGSDVERKTTQSSSAEVEVVTSSASESKPKGATNDHLIKIQRQEILELKASLKELKEQQALFKAQRKETKELKTRLRQMNQNLESVSKENVELKKRMKVLNRDESTQGESTEEAEEVHAEVTPKSPLVNSTETDVCIDEGVPAHNTYDEAWNTHFKNLQQFKRTYGNFRVTRQYDKVLNEWVSRQRRVLCGKKKGVMNRPRLDALQRIGFSLDEDDEEQGEPDTLDLRRSEGQDNEKHETDHAENGIDFDAYPDGVPASNPLDRQWNARYLQLVEYRKKYDHCRVNTAYNKALASWVIYQRQLYNGTKRGNRGEIIGMEPMRIAALNSIGMDWGEGQKPKPKRAAEDVAIQGESNGGAMESDVESRASKKQREDSEKIGESDSRLTSSKAQSEAIGSSPKLKPGGKRGLRSGASRPQIDEKLWAANYRRLKRFHSQNGHLRVAMFSDRALFIWINRLRKLYHSRGKGGLKNEWIKSLNAVGFEWNDPERSYKGDNEVGKRDDKVVEDSSRNKNIGQARFKHNLILHTQPADSSESEDQADTETSERSAVDDGDSLVNPTYHEGVKESNPRDKIWNQHFQNLQRFKAVYGTFRVTRTLDSVLNEWVSRQRLVYSGKKKGDLNEARRDALNEIGFEWGNEMSG